MASKHFAFQLIFRVALLLLSLALLTISLIGYDLIFVPALLLLLVAGQCWEVIWFVNRTNRELKKFIDAMHYGDYSINFHNENLGKSFAELNQSFNEVTDQLREARAEKQSEYELLKAALENISLGLIILDPQKSIVFMNTAAQGILEIPQFQSWQLLQSKKPDFTAQLGQLETEGRRLIEINTAGENRECYLDISRIELQGRRYKLISFSDLKKEIEQKEIEAWHKLIRILAHEVMNSVTPVTSLSETLRAMLTDREGEALNPSALDESKIEDMILALDTIIRRSKGMLNFVEDYRKLTRLPAPNFELIGVKGLLEETAKLMSGQATEKKVKLRVEMPNNRIGVKADRKMLEQSLINLISNAIHALEGTRGAEIVLGASLTESNLVISVSDNGPGIPEDILPSIFIPFFSTRKEGTGIGLTLSKNIMRLHRGSINVISKPGEGASFELLFSF